ncbi:thionin-like protein 2 [Durio zibethinus]|uniref:Thionin-like protein 2 n=1 Tax=Durio zibethinus TaxID=66656 RepID=A0A6P6BJC9_DURZI|nr:thionin-like protein 2 [Durio zibethinus]
MEKRGVSLILMVCLVMSTLVEQSRAQGGIVIPIGVAAICFGACFAPCVLQTGTTAGSCAIDCIKNCLFKSTAGGVKDTQYFCNLGCSTTLCSSFSTKENPAAKKVGSCMESCSATCAKKN